MNKLTELRQLLEAATPGPWSTEDIWHLPFPPIHAVADGHRMALAQPLAMPEPGEMEANAALIAAAVNALPALLDVAEAAREYRLAGDHLSELEAKNRLDAALAALEEVKP